MEKIVILGNRKVKNDLLVTCLKVLFPECQIEIYSIMAGLVDKPFGKDNERKGKDENFG